MNIFVTNVCPIVSAYEHCHRHSTKMCTELGQMLSTAHRLEGNSDERLMKISHQNHPCSKWIRTSAENYMWAYEHFLSLGEVFSLKSGKEHGAIIRCKDILKKPPTSLLTGRLTSFARAMDDDIKTSVIDTQKAYQKYLNRKFQEWMTRDKPLKVEFVLDTPEWIDDTTRKLMKEMEK